MIRIRVFDKNDNFIDTIKIEVPDENGACWAEFVSNGYVRRYEDVHRPNVRISGNLNCVSEEASLEVEAVVVREHTAKSRLAFAGERHARHHDDGGTEVASHQQVRP